jgi:beta-glucosidase
MGQEFYDKGAHLQMGPGVNVVRVPQNGRAFEYISGEDPFLGSAMGEQVTWGI